VKFRKYKSPGSVEVLAELIQAEGETLWSEIHKLNNTIWNKEKFPYKLKASIIVPMYKKGNKTGISMVYYGISLP
jgi:hypothetical protein